MSPAEFGFLVLGLVLGGAAGAAIVEVLRARPDAQPEVRVTIAPEAVARRRPATLASGDREDGGLTATDSVESRTPVLPAAPASGGEGEERDPLPVGPGRPSAERPSVFPSDAVAIPIVPDTAPQPVPALTTRGALALAPLPPPVLVAMAGREVARHADEPATTGDRDTETGGQTAAVNNANTELRARAATKRATGDSPAATEGPDADISSAATTAGASDAGDDRCAEARRTAEERCRGAEAAREQAKRVADEASLTQRQYDTHRRRADAAENAADPRATRAAKEAAHAAFRAARGGAPTAEVEEAAAREWLTEINRINQSARDAARILEQENAAARSLIPRLERLALEADAARIAAETAEAACLTAREAVAMCDEAEVPPPPRPPDAEVPRPGDEMSAIVRLLRGDRAALEFVATNVAGDQIEERRRWRSRIGALVEAIVARAIDATALDFPEEHAFWGTFSRSQGRDITGALAALGFRFDGLGGWVDDRVPGQRELSLAVGYAGLDPMRIRHWPRDAELRALFEDVTVAADEWLVAAAGDLTLGEMVDALGRRADELTDIWDAWGRLRPLLLGAAPGPATNGPSTADG